MEKDKKFKKWFIKEDKEDDTSEEPKEKSFNIDDSSTSDPFGSSD